MGHEKYGFKKCRECGYLYGFIFRVRKSVREFFYCTNCGFSREVEEGHLKYDLILDLKVTEYIPNYTHERWVKIGKEARVKNKLPPDRDGNRIMGEAYFARVGGEK